MARREGTKEKYLVEALKLFAERGYDSVKLSEIAERVGVVPSALYKHYQNKEQLYQAILEKSVKEFEEIGKQLKINLDENPDAAKSMLENPREVLLGIAKNLFSNTIHAAGPATFRKMMMIEQYHLKDLAELYDERYVYAQYSRFENLFDQLMKAGKMKKGDAYSLAVLFISPASLLIGLVDRHPEKEEWAWQTYEKAINQFFDDYII